MKFVYQLCIILLISFIGEVLHTFISLPIPASIYGLIIMLFCLKTGIVKLEKVKRTGMMLLEIMPLMFVPAAVGLIDAWNELSAILLPVIVITLATTVIVMAATGKATEAMLQRNRGQEK